MSLGDLCPGVKMKYSASQRYLWRHGENTSLHGSGRGPSCWGVWCRGMSRPPAREKTLKANNLDAIGGLSQAEVGQWGDLPAAELFRITIFPMLTAIEFAPFSAVQVPQVYFRLETFNFSHMDTASGRLLGDQRFWHRRPAMPGNQDTVDDLFGGKVANGVLKPRLTLQTGADMGEQHRCLF